MRKAASILVFILVTFNGTVWAEDPINADRPGIADGSVVVGAHSAQVELGFHSEYKNSYSGSNRDQQVPTLLRLGLNDEFELRLEGSPLEYSRSNDAGEASSYSGYDPVSLGVKYEFVKGDDENPTFGAILRIFPPSGSSHFQTKRVNSDLRFTSDFNLRPLSLVVNLGGALYEDEQNDIFPTGLGAVTITKNITEKLAVFVDCGSQEPERRHGHVGAVLDGGVTYLLDNDTQVDISAGSGVAGDDTPDVFWEIGISHRFKTS